MMNVNKSDASKNSHNTMSLLRCLFPIMFLLLFASIASAQCNFIPLSYCGRTDQNNVNITSAPTLGATGTTTTDPDFGTQVLRVTGSGYCGDTGPPYGTFNLSAEYIPAFAPDSSGILLHNDTTGYWFHQPLNPSTTPISLAGSCTNMFTSKRMSHGLMYGFTTPVRIYGLDTDGRHFDSWDVNPAHAATQIFDTTAIPGCSMSSFGWLANYVVIDKLDHWTAWGAGAQDTAKLACLYNLRDGNTQVINLTTAQEQQNGNSAVALNGLTAEQLSGCGIHALEIHPDASYLHITANNCSNWPNGGTVGDFFWQIGTPNVYVMPSYTSGHAVTGYSGVYINTPGQFSPCSYDPRGWTMMTATNLGTVGSIHSIAFPQCFQGTTVRMDFHPTWLNNANDANVNKYPMIAQSDDSHSSDFYSYEIIAIDTAPALAQLNRSNWGVPVRSTIWRLGHTWDEISSSQCIEPSYGAPNVSQDGKFVAFISDWRGGTGTGACTNNRRDDVFIIDTRTANRELLLSPTNLKAVVQ